MGALVVAQQADIFIRCLHYTINYSANVQNYFISIPRAVDAEAGGLPSQTKVATHVASPACYDEVAPRRPYSGVKTFVGNGRFCVPLQKTSAMEGRKLILYLDTSVIGGYYDDEFLQETQQLFQSIKDKKKDLISYENKEEI
jgi:hypothetical protein